MLRALLILGKIDWLQISPLDTDASTLIAFSPAGDFRVRPVFTFVGHPTARWLLHTLTSHPEKFHRR